MNGKLFGIGLGPGDSGLITLKAVETMGFCDEILVPKPSGDEPSLAKKIAGKWIEGKTLHELVFPMTTNREELAGHWGEAAALVAGRVREGKKVAFLTLGDPLLYSTFIYLLEQLREGYSDVPVEIIPGITSPQACASQLGVPLAKGKESLTITPAIPLERLEKLVASEDNLVIMKVGASFREIVDVLRRQGRIGNAALVSRTGLEGASIVSDLEGEVDPQTAYLSTIIVKGRSR